MIAVSPANPVVPQRPSEASEPVSMSTRIKLTPSQRSAVGIYLIEANLCEDEEDQVAGIAMHGSTLTLDMSAELAREILIEAINDADVGDNTTPDRGARTALENVLRKLR